MKNTFLIPIPLIRIFGSRAIRAAPGALGNSVVKQVVRQAPKQVIKQTVKQTPKAVAKLTTSQTKKAINTLGKRISEHKQKLADYKKNPISGDNKGTLKNASPEHRQKVIDGRIRSLEKEIKKLENERKKLQ